MPHLHYFHVSDVLKSIREALFIFPEHEELQTIYAACVDSIKLPENIIIESKRTYQEVN